MTSQERFWQARLMSKEAEHRGELSAIHQQLDALKVRHVHTGCTSRIQPLKFLKLETSSFLEPVWY